MPNVSPLASLSATRDVLDAHGLAAKKALGQNFLVNDGIVGKIVALSEVCADDRVLEVGPGIGTLTIALLKNAAHVTSVERDADLPAVLAQTCAPWADHFTLVQKDALDLELGDFAACGSAVGEGGVAWDDASVAGIGGGEPSQDSAQKLRSLRSTLQSFAPSDGGLGDFAQTLPNKFIANLPYAVAATLVLDYFQRIPSLQSATVMVQKEVADRMSASSGTKSYGAYTVKLSLFARPVGRFAVGPQNFFPAPHVESSVLRLDRCTPAGSDGRPLGDEAVRAACTMADAAFASRRKTLANSCKTYFAGRGAQGARVLERLPQLFERAGIDAKVRGESLVTEDFIRLGEALLAVAE